MCVSVGCVVNCGVGCKFVIIEFRIRKNWCGNSLLEDVKIRIIGTCDQFFTPIIIINSEKKIEI